MEGRHLRGTRGDSSKMKSVPWFYPKRGGVGVESHRWQGKELVTLPHMLMA